MIVERQQLHASRQSLANALHFGVHGIRHHHRVAVRLAIDIQQDSGLLVSRNNCVDGFDRWRNAGDVADVDGSAGRRGLDDDGGDLGRSARLPAHQAQNQLVIILDQSGRIDEIPAADGVQQVRNGDGGLQQFHRIRLNLEFGFLPALHHNGRDPRGAVQPRLNLVGGHFPDPGLRHGI